MADDLSHVLGDFEETTAPARAQNIIQVTGDDPHTFDTYHDCARLARGATREEAAGAVVAGLNNAAIGQCPHFAVHSGVAAGPGGIVAIPAESGNGKTTLTASLVKRGFGYLSDEALVFDDDARVLPYPKPFALSPWSAGLLDVPHTDAEVLVTASDLGGFVADGGQLTDLVVSEYGHPGVSLEPLPKSQAIAALIRYSFNHYKDPERAFRIATGVARDLRVWRLEYDNPLETADLLAAKLG